jgi:acyl-CoA synthetase (AMP-forming)/AMP-acid ligase II
VDRTLDEAVAARNKRVERRASGSLVGKPMTVEGAAEETVRVTLDALFRRTRAHRGDALALLDPPDRASVTDGTPRALTYAQADDAISALANMLRGFGLPTGSVVAIQLPNTVESVIALLGVLRAGMVAVPLPLLWREAEAADALARVSARALIGCRTVGEVDYSELAMRLAAETFTVRFVGAFGTGLPDGVVPLDDIFMAAAAEPVERGTEAPDQVAVATFDVTADGLAPVWRTHAEVIAGGIAVQLEARLAPAANLIGTLALSSFAGLATTIVPWLMTGGTLALHHPFAPAALAQQRSAMPHAVTVLPGPLVAQLAEAGLIGRDGAPALAIWRAPERLAAAAPYTGGALTDIAVFGEIGLIAARRTNSPPALPVRGSRRSAAGTLILSGAMVPGDVTEGIDTLHPCRIDRAAGLLTIDGPPAGLVSVGGYRFALRALQDLVGGAEDGTLAALPDMLAGHRLAGAGADRNAICDALTAKGANPLLIAAFRARRPGDRATAA